MAAQEVFGDAVERMKVSFLPYRGTSLTRNSTLVGPYSRPMPRALWWSKGGGVVFYERGTPVVRAHYELHLPSHLVSERNKVAAQEVFGDAVQRMKV